MKSRIIMLSGVKRKERHRVMTEVNDAILHSGGWVDGHTLLSNIATVFQLELPVKGFQDRAETLYRSVLMKRAKRVWQQQLAQTVTRLPKSASRST